MRRIFGVALLVGALVATGCGASDTVAGNPTPSSASALDSIAEDVPTGFDPCNIPQDVLTAVYPGLRKYGPDGDADANRGKVKWRGCGYQVTGDGFAAGVTVTNLTLEMVREKNFPGREDTVDGRTVLTTHQDTADPTGAESCRVYVGMKDGSLELHASNGKSAPDTQHLTACEIGMMMARNFIPLIEPGA